MKKILILIISVLILTSCGMTNKERIEGMDTCTEAGYEYYMTMGWNVKCSVRKIDKHEDVNKCIREYTRGLDEKYNNPDTVVNLREDNYSQVVKTCNEIFGKKELKK